MDRQRWTDQGQRAGLGESRTQVLDLLRAADQPLGVREVAERVGLHFNTARFHLDGLVEAGLAIREAESRTQPGRPRMVYRISVTAPETDTRSYRLLAEILTGVAAYAAPKPSAAAMQAGRDWGHYLADRPPPYQRMEAAEAMEKLSAILADIGFNPKLIPDGQRPQIVLRHCPFREIAEHHQEVVCAIHLGLMQGALAEMRAPLTAEKLEPFVEPNLCQAHLRLDEAQSHQDQPEPDQPEDASGQV